MPETPEDAALVEAMHETYYRDLNFAVPEAMARVLAVVRERDAPTLATLTASLAEAEARAGRAEAAVERLEVENFDLKVSVRAFGAPAMALYARDRGLPDGHLFPNHYDILKAAGARMDSFTRAALSPSAQEAPK